MGVGYTTILYDKESLEDGISEIAACQYDGVEIGLEKVRHVGAETLSSWLDEYDIDLYCVMSEWLETEEAVERVADDAEMVADLGAEFLGLLPPQRGRQDDDTVERWLTTICEAAEEAGITPVLHHHGATHVEQPHEIAEWLERAPDNLKLLYDTAHYYPYAGDEGVTGGLHRFADDIAYVHLKDIDPGSDFAEHTRALTEGDFHLDNVINYFRAFTDLGHGDIDFNAVHDTLEDVDYDGNITIEIENQNELSVVHAKMNYDHWTAITGE